MFGTSLDIEDKTCVFGLIERKGFSGDMRTEKTRCLFQARKLIAQKWQAKVTPTVEEWMKVMKYTIWKEKCIYSKRGDNKKYERFWKLWLEVD